MKTIFFLPVIIAISSSAMAGQTCNAPKDKWMKESDFKKNVEAQGYQIKTFKISKGCYEIYGRNKSGKKVEIYFDPATGSAVESK